MAGAAIRRPLLERQLTIKACRQSPPFMNLQKPQVCGSSAWRGCALSQLQRGLARCFQNCRLVEHATWCWPGAGPEAGKQRSPSLSSCSAHSMQLNSRAVWTHAFLTTVHHTLPKAPATSSTSTLLPTARGQWPRSAKLTSFSSSSMSCFLSSCWCSSSTSSCACEGQQRGRNGPQPLLGLPPPAQVCCSAARHAVNSSSQPSSGGATWHAPACLQGVPYHQPLVVHLFEQGEARAWGHRQLARVEPPGACRPTCHCRRQLLLTAICAFRTLERVYGTHDQGYTLAGEAAAR